MYVFLDTSIFETNNFLEGRRINELLKLSEEKEITVILTEITYNEIISRFRKNLKDVEGALKSFRDKTRAWRNLPSKVFFRQATFSDSIDKEADVEEFKRILDERLRISNVIVVNYPTINISTIFDKYFTKSLPFGENQKKDEFPDAFALLILEEWCKKNNQKCNVLSTDKDMTGYENSWLLVHKDYEAFLDKIVRAVDANKAVIAKVLQYFSLNGNKIKVEVEDWLLANLDDENKFAAAVNSFKALSVDVLRHDATLVGSPKILSVSTSFVEIEVQVEVSYEVKVAVPEDDAWYDYEKDSYQYMWTKDKVFSEKQIIPVLLDIDTYEAGANATGYNLEVIEINKGEDLVINGGQPPAYLRATRGFRPDLWH
jgi:hypothetical protein